MKEVVICKVCAGTGCVRTEKRTHWNEYEYTKEPCKNCNGTGRLIKVITYEPYEE